VQAELRPGDCLAEFLERPKPSRQRDECVREPGHRCLALVHRFDNAKIGQAGVGDFAIAHRLRYHADDLAAASEDLVGKKPHQADAGAAVDKADAAADELGCQHRRRRAVVVAVAGARAAEHTDTAQGHASSVSSEHFN